MTTGEMIQLNRKKLGLSQEQLGDKLMVSRQTISLWEKDQTLPTIDNLIRLKEIFGVSVDEFLTGETESNEEQALETYEYKCSKEEIDSIYNALEQGRTPLIIFSALILAAGILTFWLSGYIPIIGFMLGALSIHIIYNVMLAAKTKKFKKKSTETLPEEKLKINVYEDSFCIECYREEILFDSIRFKYSELNNVKETNDHFLIEYLSLLYHVRKQELPENSILYRELSTKVLESQPKHMTRGQRNACYILILSTFLSVLLSYIIVLAISPEHILSYDVTWVTYLFIPVPLALFILGMYFKKHRIRFKKSLLIGAIGIIYFAAMGSFWLKPYIIKPENSKYSEYYLQSLEEKLGFEFPEADEINYIYVSDMDQESNEYFWLDSLFSAYYSENANKTLISKIKDSDIWLEEIPKKLKSVKPPLLEPDCYDYVTFYNNNDETFNALPKHSDEPNFYTCVFYRSDQQVIEVFEYEVNA